MTGKGARNLKDVGDFMLLPPEECDHYLAMVEKHVEQMIAMIEADV